LGVEGGPAGAVVVLAAPVSTLSSAAHPALLPARSKPKMVTRYLKEVITPTLNQESRYFSPFAGEGQCRNLLATPFGHAR